jgi:hypothetical protein
MEFVTIHGNKKYFKANYKFYYNISCEFFWKVELEGTSNHLNWKIKIPTLAIMH